MNFKAAHGKVERICFLATSLNERAKGKIHIHNITCDFALICKSFDIFVSVIELYVH